MKNLFYFSVFFQFTMVSCAVDLQSQPSSAIKNIPQLISPQDAPELHSPDWDSSSKRVFVASNELNYGGYGKIYLIDLDTHSFAKVTDNENGTFENPVWVDQANRIFAWSTFIDPPGIVEVGLNGEIFSLGQDGVIVDVSGNNQLLVGKIIQEVDRDSRVIEVTLTDTSNSTPTVVFEKEYGGNVEILDMVLSPSNEFVALAVNLLGVSDNGDVLYVIDLVDKTYVEFAVNDIGYRSINWSSNSEKIAFQIYKEGKRDTTFLRILSLQNGCFLDREISYALSSPKLSPDGKLIVFSIDSKIYLLDSKSVFDDLLKDSDICN